MNPKSEIDWQPLLDRLQRSDDQHLPMYPGNLKAALFAHAGLTNHPKAETAYQLATEIARLTTCCDPEIIYWFSQLIRLVDAQLIEIECDPSRVTRRDRPTEKLPPNEPFSLRRSRTSLSAREKR